MVARLLALKVNMMACADLEFASSEWSVTNDHWT